MKNVVTCFTRCKMYQFLPGSWDFACLLVGYLFVTRWLLIHALLQLFDAASHEVPSYRRHWLEKNSGILPERWYFFLHLWSICQMFIGLLFITEPCINNVQICKHKYGFCLDCSTWFYSFFWSISLCYNIKY